MSPEQFDTLQQRVAYLDGRAELKRSMGWDWQYEVREREALDAALSFVAAHHPHLQHHQTGTRPTPGTRRP
ncbi:MAG TPA: hypothetical protein VGB61_07880 [Pyrinomonadaceae bacterium]